MDQKIKIDSVNIETYIDKKIKGGNCDFTYYDAEFTRHIIYGTYKHDKIAITLWRTEGECGSGWVAADFGHCSIKYVDQFPKTFSMVPIKEINITIPKEIRMKDVLNKEQIFYKYSELDDDNYDKQIKFCDKDEVVFSFSLFGDDSYYPSGGYKINMSLFQ